MVDGQTEERLYRFASLPIRLLNNERLGLSSRALVGDQKLSSLQQDVVALLVLGSAATDETVSAILARCEIGDYLGQPDKLKKYIRQRYLWVSRITGGSQSNNPGQLAQTFVRSYVQEHLNIADVEYRANGHIPSVRHTGDDDERETTFDLVVSKGNRYIAIEVSFQVTTNSVIERKSGQA